MKKILRIFILLLLIYIVSSVNLTSSIQELFANNMVKYTGEIEHLFTHCIIAYPEIAFKNNNFMKNDYDKDCLTILEFENILKNLYEKEYILVKISEVYEVKDGKSVKKELMLPKGKKPLILSFDDVNYDSKKLGRGMVDKIILDENNNLATYTKNAKNTISYNNEHILILENFIKKYPNFSFNGAKGLLCVTGYDGILGYRTHLNSNNREEEITKVKPIIKKLKDNGWEFASHSYGHYHITKISNEGFYNEVKRWQNEVEPLIGKTNIYAYPYGEYEIANEKKEITYKHKLLEKAGFNMFLGVGKKYFFGYAPFNIKKEDRVLFMDRRPLDGNNLRKNHKEYKIFFNSYEVYDHKNRTVPFYNE